MSNEKNDGGYAFPKGGGNSSYGMTLRDYFAAKAMQGIATNEALRKIFVSLGKDGKDAIDKIAEGAYGMADAMLKAREE